MTPAVPVDEAHGTMTTRESQWRGKRLGSRRRRRPPSVAHRPDRRTGYRSDPASVRSGRRRRGFRRRVVTAPARRQAPACRSQTDRVAVTIPVGRAPWGVAVGGGAVWVAIRSMARCRGSTQPHEPGRRDDQRRRKPLQIAVGSSVWWRACALTGSAADLLPSGCSLRIFRWRALWGGKAGVIRIGVLSTARAPLRRLRATIAEPSCRISAVPRCAARIRRMASRCVGSGEACRARVRCVASSLRASTLAALRLLVERDRVDVARAEWPATGWSCATMRSGGPASRSSIPASMGR